MNRDNIIVGTEYWLDFQKRLLNKMAIGYKYFECSLYKTGFGGSPIEFRYCNPVFLQKDNLNLNIATAKTFETIIYNTLYAITNASRKKNYLICDKYGLTMYDNIGLEAVNCKDITLDSFQFEGIEMDKWLISYLKQQINTKFYLTGKDPKGFCIDGVIIITETYKPFNDYNIYKERKARFAEEQLFRFFSMNAFRNNKRSIQLCIYSKDLILNNEEALLKDFNRQHLDYFPKYPLDTYSGCGYDYKIGEDNGWVVKFYGGQLLKDLMSIRKEKEQYLIKQEEDRKRREEEARLEKFRYNKRNSHRRDYCISFDEANHKYTVGGVNLQSVTNIVENCFPKFDAQLHAKTTAAKLGITPQEVINMWERKGKESRELGTAMHQKIESYYQGKQPYEDDAFRLFKIFADKVKLEPFRTEWAVYDTDYNIAGTIDFVDYQDGKYTIYDWKRSDKIIANGMPVKVSKYQEKGLYPLEHLENCAYYHYALQLSLYKFILEKNYDIKVSDLRLGIFHPSYDKPYVLKMPYLENEVKTLMELRSEVIL